MDVRAGKRSMDGCLRYAIHGGELRCRAQARSYPERKATRAVGRHGKRHGVVRQSEQAARSRRPAAVVARRRAPTRATPWDGVEKDRDVVLGRALRRVSPHPVKRWRTWLPLSRAGEGKIKGTGFRVPPSAAPE